MQLKNQQQKFKIAVVLLVIKTLLCKIHIFFFCHLSFFIAFKMGYIPLKSTCCVLISRDFFFLFNRSKHVKTLLTILFISFPSHMNSIQKYIYVVVFSASL